MQAAQANNLAPSQQQIVNASAMLDGMDERSKTRLLQTQMNTMGYSVGTADGVAGPATRRALQNFQRDYGLNVSGRFDADTIDVLMLNMLADQQTTAAPTTTQQPSNTALLLLQQQLQQRTGGTVNNQPGVSNEAQTLLNLMNSLPK
ncbi:peptidoglycan-binding protein [Nitrincola tapanii]|uniref:Peptidoglycan-binding protein n=2 Tax=Nitrincola tapanii TaxID=1708751 RepID=A0A5A9WB33_9GAMM|nr:peptidoglycan-binding protein [Nitrincola tapanii]